ncbi:MAG: hypothetical protein F9K40_07865 [Kofleriaceae bacterium]|nr:MAG: hypothetical protein F9K40_07865 [Kofleriaceae bacterium]MBZ0234278.1 hypothetical protein [Kofleriaceae bacterium]
MIRSAFTTTALFLALAAGPAVAESTKPAPSPDVPVDVFGLPCEVTFAPKAAAPAKGAKARKASPVRPVSSALATSGLSSPFEFELGRTDRGPSYKPDADAELRMKAATLTPAMAGVVVRENATAIELCMTRLPRGSRTRTVGLVMTIEPTGGVSTAKVVGAPKAPAFASCLAAAAATWKFPHTDAVTEIEYPVTIHGK